MLSGQHEADDDLPVHVELAGRHEPEPFVQRGWAAVLRDVAGQQLGGALGRTSPATCQTASAP